MNIVTIKVRALTKERCQWPKSCHVGLNCLFHFGICGRYFSFLGKVEIVYRAIRPAA